MRQRAIWDYFTIGARVPAPTTAYEACRHFTSRPALAPICVHTTMRLRLSIGINFDEPFNLSNAPELRRSLCERTSEETTSTTQFLIDEIDGDTRAHAYGSYAYRNGSVEPVELVKIYTRTQKLRYSGAGVLKSGKS